MVQPQFSFPMIKQSLICRMGAKDLSGAAHMHNRSVARRVNRPQQPHLTGLHGVRIALPLLLVIGLFFSQINIALAQYEPPHDNPGPAVERLFFKSFNVDRAPLDLAAGDMDIYYFNLKIAAARELRAEGGAKLFEAPASTLSLILNPAPAPAGQLNPFSIKEVRQAMQLLVDREFVAREIYQGQALPMFTHLTPNAFDYLTVFNVVQEADLRYDPEFAREIITDAMIAAGAELVDDAWHYEGNPVRIKFIVRVEDERRELGNLVRVALEEAGFQVQQNLQPFAPAIQSVYSTDPKLQDWHIYTEGWGRGAPNRYDRGSVNSFNAPWLGNMPGWREVGFWQYENEEMDTLGKQLFRGDFASRGERDEIYRTMTQMGLDESVRIWVATVLNTFPAQPELVGITEDLAAGPRGLWSLREAYIPGKDELTVGHLWVWTERTTWNPIGGLGDVYGTDIWRNLHDPPMWNHPFTGLPQPFRVQYDVETAGPEDELDVPADAFLWDADRSQWSAVGEAITATSKITYDYSTYFQAPWHHGQPISMADVIYSLYQGYDLSYNPDKARIETVLAVTSRPFLETIKGYRVLDENNIEVYVDFWHFEPDYIASYATPSGLAMPWELNYAMDTLVFDQKRAAYSDIAAARYSVPWISLVLDRDARLVRKAMLDMQRAATFPENVFTLPGAAEDTVLLDAATASVHYQAALDWFEEKGHMVISNGPFALERYDPPAQFAELLAFRNENYPFKPGDLYKGTAQLVEFTETNAQPIEIGSDYEAALTLNGPGTLAVRYLLTDAATGAIIQAGDAEAQGDNQFTIALTTDVTDQLDLGLYELSMAAYSDELAQMTERTVELEADFLVEAATPVEVAADESTSDEAAAEPSADSDHSAETAPDTSSADDAAVSSEESSENAASETETQVDPPLDGGSSTNIFIYLVPAVVALAVVGFALMRRRGQAS